MTVSTGENFIPVNKSELALSLLKRFRVRTERKQFSEFCRLISSVFHFQYHFTLEILKELYIPFDPDADKLMVSAYTTGSNDNPRREADLYRLLEELLTAGNYTRITDEKLEKAFTGVSPWGLQLDVDFSSYDRYAIYYKGERRDSFERKVLFRKKTYDFDVYGRVFFLFRLKDGAVNVDDTALSPDKIYLKIFKNVPEIDMEMLFPTMNIRIRWIDKAKVIIPLIAGGISSIYKIFSYILVQGNPVRLWTQVGFWTLVGSFFIFALKSFTNYKNTVEKYLKTLATSLYIQNLDNNSGVITYLTDEAEEQEFREAVLAYYFLLSEPEKKHTMQSLDESIEIFLREEFALDADFEVDDAVSKLLRLSLVERRGKYLKAVPLKKALRILDEKWDGFFTYNR